MKTRPGLMKFFLNIYPPYLGTGISVKKISPDFKEVVVQMKMHWYNRNYMKTHFGGSLYAMTDPFYMLMLIQILGKDYIVWDKSAQIEFIKPGVNTVTARFVIEDEQVEKTIQNTADGKKYYLELLVNVENENGKTAAKVSKVLYIRKKADKQVSP